MTDENCVALMAALLAANNPTFRGDTTYAAEMAQEILDAVRAVRKEHYTEGSR